MHESALIGVDHAPLMHEISSIGFQEMSLTFQFTYEWITRVTDRLGKVRLSPFSWDLEYYAINTIIFVFDLVVARLNLWISLNL